MDKSKQQCLGFMGDLPSSDCDHLLAVAFGPRPGQPGYQPAEHQMKLDKAVQVLKRLEEDREIC